MFFSYTQLYQIVSTWSTPKIHKEKTIPIIGLFKENYSIYNYPNRNMFLGPCGGL